VGGDLQEGSPIEPRVRGADGTGLETRAAVLVVGGSSARDQQCGGSAACASSAVRPFAIRAGLSDDAEYIALDVLYLMLVMNIELSQLPVLSMLLNILEVFTRCSPFLSRTPEY